MVERGLRQPCRPLPLHPPDQQAALWIFTAFHAEFRRFEQRHLAKKTAILESKYDRTFKAIYRDLREARPDQIDTLWESSSYVVLATRPVTHAILLDQPVKPLRDGQWCRNGCQLTVSATIEEMVVFQDWPDLNVGDVLIHHAHARSDEQVHSQLIDVWRPRWQRLQEVDGSTLDRLTGFVQHFMPKHSFQLGDITPDEWYKSVARLKPQAARGPDGFARLDLLKMPLFYVQILIQFLMDIESGKRSWPQQMLIGFVLALAKRQDAHQADEYRPTVLFSMVFRIWGSLRCRQLLRLLESHVHSDAHGFLPGMYRDGSSSSRRALWTCYYLKKAFNNIQRPQWFRLAEWVGIPQWILRPWQDFLSRFTRRFQVHNNLSPPLHSDVGFAEGDPLSVMAMAVLDWGLHVYMDALAPSVRTMTFVDNISLLSTNVGHLVLSFFALQTFLQLWGLQIDVGKSYAWSTLPEQRQALSHLGLGIVSDAAELGGSLTLGASRRVRLFLARGAKLTEKWTRLRLSRAPLHQKLVCLATVFWSAALHGSLGCSTCMTFESWPSNILDFNGGG